MNHFFILPNKLKLNELNQVPCKKLKVHFDHTHITISHFSRNNPFKLHRFKNIFALIAVDSKAREIEQNIQFIYSALDKGCRLEDMLFMLPSLTGFSDCILATSNAYLVAPGINSAFTIFSNRCAKDTPTQRKLNLLLNSLFQDFNYIHDWNLVSKNSILIVRSRDILIKRFPRFYSQSYKLSSFDQLLNKDNNNTFADVNLISKVLFEYVESINIFGFDTSQHNSLFSANNNYDFHAKCNQLKQYIMTLKKSMAGQYLSIDNIVLALILSRKDFVNHLLELYLNAMEVNYAYGICSPPLKNWYIQSLSALISPYLQPLMRSILLKNSLTQDLYIPSLDVICSDLVAQ